MSRKAQHVVPRDGKWAVRKTGADRVTRRFDTQREAIEAARELARKQKTELYIHGKDGRIRERDSFGTTHFQRKDRRNIWLTPTSIEMFW